MSLVLLSIAAVAVAVVLGRWWAVTVPALVGLAVAGGIAATGGSLGDTPLPFLVLVATVATACGLIVRRRVTPAP